MFSDSYGLQTKDETVKTTWNTSNMMNPSSNVKFLLIEQRKKYVLVAAKYD